MTVGKEHGRYKFDDSFRLSWHGSVTSTGALSQILFKIPVFTINCELRSFIKIPFIKFGILYTEVYKEYRLKAKKETSMYFRKQNTAKMFLFTTFL